MADTTKEFNRNFVIAKDSDQETIYVTTESGPDKLVWGKVHPIEAVQYLSMGEAIDHLHSVSKEAKRSDWSIRRLNDREQALIDSLCK